MRVPGQINRLRSAFEEFRSSRHTRVVLLREIIYVLLLVGGVALGLFLVSGTWPAVVTIESGSMIPHMNVGDLVFVVEENRFGDLQTWVDGKDTGYTAFGDYGDVIVYRPNGAGTVTPIIHRAMVWADAAAVALYFPDSHEGYITKGDNNPAIDQGALLPGVGVIEPVKGEWVVGKALFAVPLLGYIPLHAIEVAVIILVVLLVQEWWKRRQKPGESARSSGK